MVAAFAFCAVSGLFRSFASTTVSILFLWATTRTWMASGMLSHVRRIGLPGLGRPHSRWVRCARHTLRSRFVYASGRRTADMATRLTTIARTSSSHASSIGPGDQCSRQQKQLCAAGTLRPPRVLVSGILARPNMTHLHAPTHISGRK